MQKRTTLNDCFAHKKLRMDGPVLSRAALYGRELFALAAPPCLPLSHTLPLALPGVPPMAEFAPNLDDGELWLPSEIIADVGLQRYHHSSAAAARVRSQRHAAEVERLAHQLAALRRLDAVHLLPAFDHPRSALPLHLEGFEHFGPLVRFEPAERELRAAMLPQSRGATLPGAYGERFGVGLRPETIQHFPAKAVQLQVPQRQHRPLHSRLGSLRRDPSGRECGGTGVFLPRVYEGEKRYMAGGEQQKQRGARSTAMWKQGNPFQPSSEPGLPQEWTYGV